MAEVPIPPPWVAHQDAGSGKTYYYNPETNVTSWDRPSPPSQAPPPATPTPPPVMAAALVAPPVAVDSTTPVAPADAAVAPPPANTAESEVQPADSQRRESLAAVDPATGRTYYYDPTTGETSWAPAEENQPTAQASSAPSSIAAANLTPATSVHSGNSAVQSAAEKGSSDNVVPMDRRLSVAAAERESIVGDPGETANGKSHGICLSRTSTRTILLREWKPCFWVLNDATLLIFRDADAYRAYHENTYLDDETKAYLLKAKVELTADHHCKHMTKKEFLGVPINSFALQHSGEYGTTTCVKFANTRSEPMMELRGALHSAISEQQSLSAGRPERQSLSSKLLSRLF